MPDRSGQGTASWHEEVLALNRVDDLLAHIAERAVRELRVTVAVATGVPRSDGHLPPSARWSDSDDPALHPEPITAGDEVVAPTLSTRAWWPVPVPVPVPGSAPSSLPSALMVDLSGAPGDVSRRARLDLHADTADFFGDTQVLEAARFASYAALSLLAVERVSHLWVALESRASISQAQGMLMERFELGPEAAMNLLRRLSQHSQRPVRDLVREMTTHGLPLPDPEPGTWRSWTP